MVASAPLARLHSPFQKWADLWITWTIWGCNNTRGLRVLGRVAGAPEYRGIHPLVDLAAQAGDLAFADAFHSHGLDQVIDRAGRDALDVVDPLRGSTLDHRRQRLLGHPAGLEEGRKVAAAAELGG